MYELHQEHHFEFAICDHLGRHGWLYAEGDAAHYDKHNALFLPDLLACFLTGQRVARQAQGERSHLPHQRLAVVHQVDQCRRQRAVADPARRQRGPAPHAAIGVADVALELAAPGRAFVLELRHAGQLLHARERGQRGRGGTGRGQKRPGGGDGQEGGGGTQHGAGL